MVNTFYIFINLSYAYGENDSLYIIIKTLNFGITLDLLNYILILSHWAVSMNTQFINWYS